MTTKDTRILLLVNMEDGCQMAMNPVDGNPEGWTLAFFDGVKVVCPHGAAREFGRLENKEAVDAKV